MEQSFWLWINRLFSSSPGQENSHFKVGFFPFLVLSLLLCPCGHRSWTQVCTNVAWFWFWRCETTVPSCNLPSVHFCVSAAAAAKSLQSCPALCDPMDTAHQTPLSMGFSRQEYWSGLPVPSPSVSLKWANQCLSCWSGPSTRSAWITVAASLLTFQKCQFSAALLPSHWLNQTLG